jgi:hypothetical protein
MMVSTGASTGVDMELRKFNRIASATKTAGDSGCNLYISLITDFGRNAALYG